MLSLVFCFNWDQYYLIYVQEIVEIITLVGNVIQSSPLKYS